MNAEVFAEISFLLASKSAIIKRGKDLKKPFGVGGACR
jgi:hypothetical protein